MNIMPAFRVLLPILLALARPPAAAAEPGGCLAAIRSAERAEKLPRGLLAAMGRVESGRRGAQGDAEPWPWTINARGKAYGFATRAEALRQARRLQADGVRLIDVGCLQINLHHHPQAFTSLEEAFSPEANARYAARFLRQLKARRGSWMQAVAHYHSSQAERGGAYRQRVVLAMQAVPLSSARAALPRPSPSTAPSRPGRR